MQSGMGDEKRLCVKREYNQCDKLPRQPSKSVYDPEKQTKKNADSWRKLEAQQSVLRHCLIAHRLNVTQRLHSLDVIGCCSSNTVWFTRTSSILCVWDASVTASKTLPSSQCFSASAPSEKRFIYYAMAYKGAYAYVFAYAFDVGAHMPTRWHMTLAWNRKGRLCCVFCVCLMWRAACLTETKEIEECAAEYRLCSLMEAVLQTSARAKSGLCRAFVIRAGFLLREKLLGSVSREKPQKRMKAELKERKRNKGLSVFLRMLLECIIYIVSTPWVCYCYCK